MNLDDRKRMILSAIVSAYIETGEPVGSKVLIEREKLPLSSATVRNEMSDLERLGYLKKTHTSSGRVPSGEGYRFYVSTLRPYVLSDAEKNALGDGLQDCSTVESLLDLATQHLARFSGCTVFGIAPGSPDGICRFEVLPAGIRKLAIMVVFSGGRVKSYVFRTECDVTDTDAEKLTKIFNGVFSGFPVEQIGSLRLMLLEHELKAHCPEHAALAQSVQKILKDVREYELHVGGTENLLSYPEFADIESARGLIGLLSRQEKILDILLAQKPSDPIEIRIGAENGLFNSPHASSITLFCNDKFPVLLSLMGPARMDYARAIAGCNHFLAQLKQFIAREY